MQEIIKNSLVCIGCLLSLSCSSLMLPIKDYSKIPKIGAFIDKEVEPSTGETVYKYLTSNTFDENNQYFAQFVADSMKGIKMPDTLITSAEETFKQGNSKLPETFGIEGIGHYRTASGRKSINIFQFTSLSGGKSQVFSVYESK